jgi:GT2 family glycosyltransferase
MRLSVVTAVHNQLPMNRLYLEELRRRTDLPLELVIVDNASTDGSREFFESQGATVVANEANYSYARCQNQGIAAATGDVLAFLNNDLCFPDHWTRACSPPCGPTGSTWPPPAAWRTPATGR